MPKTVLVANVGSTSFKYQLFDFSELVELARGKVERVNGGDAVLFHSVGMGGETKKKVQRLDLGPCDYARAIQVSLGMLLHSKYGVIGSVEDIAAVGFKTVHAGPVSGSVLIDESVLGAMKEYSVVVPAHNQPYIEAIQLCRNILRGKPLVAAFETAFHQSMPDYAYTYGLPFLWQEKYNVRRYGFHGASHRYVTGKAAEVLGKPQADLKLISCHLGGSSSVCAVRGGRSVDTSMGFSAQSGLSMSSRNGDIDPYILFYLAERHGFTMEELQGSLVRESGLKGISGISGDIRDLEEAFPTNDRARLALDVFFYEVKKFIGAYVAVLGGLDALIFTGGIGENGVEVRRRICEGLDVLGITIDGEQNRVRDKLSRISVPEAAVAVLVIPTDEGLIVARETARVLREAGLS